MIENRVKLLWEICSKSGIKPSMVKLVTEFGCGDGKMTRAIRQVFTGATVQAIDVDDSLGKLKQDSAIRFIQGEFVSVLKEGQVGPADVTILYNAGDGHGFNRKTLYYLMKAVDKGYLVTGGHLGPIFNDKFRSKFVEVKSFEPIGLTQDIVWRLK